MKDIHAHILYGIDDGAVSLSQSIELIKEEIEAGVTDVFCTPHLRGGYAASAEEIRKSFDEVSREVKSLGLKINMYCGRELFVYTRGKFKAACDESINRLGGGKYVLTEYNFINDDGMLDAVYEIKKAGYIPIIAHYERYTYATMDGAERLKREGALIQVNAASIAGNGSFRMKSLARRLVKSKICDFIASDCHFGRKNRLKAAYEYVFNKCGQEYANAIFDGNIEKIIKELE